MSAPSVTYTFTNGTTIDATQVNTNYTDLIDGASDGTKDYTINSLTANGNLAFSGNGTFGSASGDDLTFNGSLASSIPIKTNATYDIGAATTGLAGVYLGNNTRTVRLVAGVITGSYTMTLPVAVPSKTGMVMTFDTSAAATFRFIEKLTASKTTTYTATSDETIIPCDASGGGFTVNLPAVSGNSGMRLLIYKTGTDTNTVTVDPSGSETIGGLTTATMSAPGSYIETFCDGSAWILKSTGYRLRSRQVFTANGTWTKPAGCRAVNVIVVGSGGAGGGSANTSGGEAAEGGGGGGGETGVKFITSGLGTTETVTVGVGGTAGTAGNNAGNNGNTSSFGSHVTAAGGSGGGGSAASGTSTAGAGGSGGTGGSGGDYYVTGQDGGNGRTLSGLVVFTSYGGGTTLAGIVKKANTASAAGTDGKLYGGGGTGCGNGASQSARQGGAGAAGIVIVEEYF